MSTTWPALSANDLVSGEGAETVAQSLFDQQQALKAARCTTVMFSAVSTASATYTTVATIRLYVPLYAVVTTDKIRLYVRALVTGGGTANYRTNNGATNGTDSANITAVTYAARSSDLVVQSGWPGTIIDLNIQGKTTAGSVFIEGEQIMSNLRFID